jgi:glycerol-3-phosphate O-acyltransferase/dihydroxyacetone phosphate acyltransferase
MFVRKSQAADSSVLSHPMLWLDERIFGTFRLPKSPPELMGVA